MPTPVGDSSRFDFKSFSELENNLLQNRIDLIENRIEALDVLNKQVDLIHEGYQKTGQGITEAITCLIRGIEILNEVKSNKLKYAITKEKVKEVLSMLRDAAAILATLKGL